MSKRMWFNIATFIITTVLILSACAPAEAPLPTAMMPIAETLAAGPASTKTEAPTKTATATASPTPVGTEELERLGFDSEIFENLKPGNLGVVQYDFEYTKSTASHKMILVGRYEGQYFVWFGDPNLRITIQPNTIWAAYPLADDADINQLIAELSSLEPDLSVFRTLYTFADLGDNNYLSVRFVPHSTDAPENTREHNDYRDLKDTDIYEFIGVDLETFRCINSGEWIQVIVPYGASFSPYCNTQYRHSVVVSYLIGGNPIDVDENSGANARLVFYLMSKAGIYVDGIPESNVFRFWYGDWSYGDWASIGQQPSLDVLATWTPTPSFTPTATSTPQPTRTPTATRTRVPTMTPLSTATP